MLWHMTRALAFPARATAALMLALGVLGAGCSEDEPSAEVEPRPRGGRDSLAA